MASRDLTLEEEPCRGETPGQAAGTGAGAVPCRQRSQAVVGTKRNMNGTDTGQEEEEEKAQRRELRGVCKAGRETKSGCPRLTHSAAFLPSASSPRVPAWVRAVGTSPAVPLPSPNPLTVSKWLCCWIAFVPYRDLHLKRHSHLVPRSPPGAPGLPGTCRAVPCRVRPVLG